MIKCNRCGSTNPASELNCQVCGTPLASKNESELSPRMVSQQNQPPLPAWLETLRAGEHSAAPGDAASSPGFSAADLLDEGTLPSWMRSGQHDQLSQDAFSANFHKTLPRKGYVPLFNLVQTPAMRTSHLEQLQPIRSSMSVHSLPGCRKASLRNRSRRVASLLQVSCNLMRSQNGCARFNPGNSTGAAGASSGARVFVFRVSSVSLVFFGYAATQA